MGPGRTFVAAAIAGLVAVGGTAPGPFVSFANSPTVSFGIAGNTVTASAVGGGGLTQATLYATGNTTQSSTGTQALSSLIFQGAGIASVGISGGSVVVSVPAGAPSPVNFSAGTTSNNLGTVVFSNSNNFSFGLNGSTITGSGGVVFSAGTVSANRTAVTFGDSNGITFGLDAGIITASHNGLTSQSNQALSAPNGSFTFQTAQFHNSNGVSWSTTTGSGIVASVAAQSAQTAGFYFVGNTTGQSSSSTVDLRTVSFDGAGIVSAGWSAGSVRISATQSNQAFSAAGGSSAFQTLSFSDNAYVSFTNNAGQVAVTEVRGSFFATSNTTQGTSGTQNLDAITFAGAGIASVGITNGSVVVSVPAGAPSPVNFSAGTTSGDLGSVVFSNSNGVSFGLNGSTITASVAGGGITMSQWAPFALVSGLGGSHGQATLQVHHFTADHYLTFDRVGLMVIRTNSTNSTGSVTLSQWFGIYTRNASTLSLLMSASDTFGMSFAGTGGSYSQHGGLRIATMGLSSSLTPGEYWIGVISRTTSAGTNCTFSQLLQPAANSGYSGILNVGTAASGQMGLGRGHYSASTTAMPGSIAFSQIEGTASLARRAPMWLLMNGSV